MLELTPEMANSLEFMTELKDRMAEVYTNLKYIQE